MINYKCGKCGAGMKAPESMAGQKERCPQCSVINIVPEPVVQGVIVPDAGQPPVSNVKMGAPPPPPSSVRPPPPAAHFTSVTPPAMGEQSFARNTANAIFDAMPVSSDEKCLLCHTPSLVLRKRGYDWVTGLVLGCLLFPLGLLFGFWGAQDIVRQCTRCGKKWGPKAFAKAAAEQW